jgi:hypothetical protein
MIDCSTVLLDATLAAAALGLFAALRATFTRQERIPARARRAPRQRRLR